MKKNGSNTYKLYCYNGNFWEQTDIPLRKYIGEDLYEFLKKILIDVFWNVQNFNSLKNKLERLKTLTFGRNVIEKYKEYGVNDSITFDDKWWLFGFNNCVYDMRAGIIRSYKSDDYVSMTTGYDWIEPSDEEIAFVLNILKKIMPDVDEKTTYLNILATTIDGRCLEKCVIFNGNGRNGKGMINDLLLTALGNYGMIGNNSILFESSKRGSDPEKANIHKKRCVIFREPPEKSKFENSVIKELTGGGKFSARGHHETDTEKELNLTMIIECNQRPLLSEEPTVADVERIIDIKFKSTFTSDITTINHSNNIFEADPYLKTFEFKNKYKYALLKILFNVHFSYLNNNSRLFIADSIKERTSHYLELSCNIIQWFKEHYTYSGLSSDILKVGEVFDLFKSSEFYQYLPKVDKKKYNKSYFTEYIQTNKFFTPFYLERSNSHRNIIRCWKINTPESSDTVIIDV